MQQYKCLALPGWLNDAEIMKGLMAQLDKALASVIKFEYLDPSYDVSKSISQLPSHIQVPQGAGSNLLKYLQETLYRWGDIHLDHSQDIANLRAKIINDPTIVGVVGFSHGTLLVTELGQLAHTDQELKKRLKFFMAFSCHGIKAKKEIYSQKRLITIPTIQSLGTRDPLELESLIQSSEFLNPVIIYTDSTHRVPIFSFEQLKKIQKFVQSALEQPKL
ncbi:unnamed protein product (macronuclear) [Paramecium tetraurelia]|uniref:Serine hydrolase domain-containing protein n=1 Tax=Paramecium tetraurelia TaxID=5888 RepID=A0D5Q5_PARTE|nr:uncharacterized protein GSPATT00013802001 [Paramecium tetraurelia]CAK78372.1 unnamed protein product [Paramecium tetraurelia]|eukprot:XP_001445769.1 hypothetical protein (macronuclear) [Paramecium tetraurelia strain d4-2]